MQHYSSFYVKRNVKQQFIMAANEAGFEVTDDTYLFEGVRGLDIALNASNSDKSLIYQFYVFDNRDTAKGSVVCHRAFFLFVMQTLYA